MKKVLVTGGNGFLGKHVVDKLRNEGHTAVSCDISIKEAVQKNERCLDVTDTRKVDWLFYETKPEVVIHLAAMAGASGKGGGAESVNDPFNFFRVNVLGTLSIFESCREHGVEKVIHMSSFSPYGVTREAVTETTPFNANNPYGASKVCCEEIAKCYAMKYGIKTVIFRAPLLCGEGQKELNALREFAYSVKKGEPIVLLGEGKHVREFVHPSDVARAFWLSIPYFDLMKNPYEIFVLGNKPISMKELAYLIAKTSGKDVPVIHKEASVSVFDQWTDYSKAERILGWKPEITVEEIVRRVIADIGS